MPDKIAFLLDGGYIKKRLGKLNKRFPTVDDVLELCNSMMAHPRLAGGQLFRIYYYDAPPYDGKHRNPIDGSETDFGSTEVARRNRSLIDSLEQQDDFAVRRGMVLFSGWKMSRQAQADLMSSPRAVTAADMEPNIFQKGVDMRVGLDMAWISLKRIADVLVLVAGDSDFIPVMKFVRREGLKVYLQPLGRQVRPELKAHADFVFR